jgi:hypothetical protein
VTKTATGEIVSTRLAKARKTGAQYGYIVIKTPDNESVRLKIDASTECKSLDRGNEVSVEYEALGNSDILVAKKVSINSESK